MKKEPAAKGEQKEIRFNKKIFHLVADEPGITRATIARRLGVSLSKAGYDIDTLKTYGFLSEYPGKNTGKGRHASGFRVHCPILFRIHDLSTQTFTCTDYTADGTVVRSILYPYYALYPLDANLESYGNRVRQGGSTTAPLMCALHLPPPVRFLDPTAPLRPSFPNADTLKKKVEEVTDHRILCTADRVSTVAKGAEVLSGDKQTFFGLHLGDEVFSIFLAPGRVPVVRSLKNCLTGNAEADSLKIAHMVAGNLYLGGVTVWYIYAERKYYAVKEMVEKYFPPNAEFPKEISWNTSFPHSWLLRYLRNRWLDQACTNFNKKITGKG